MAEALNAASGANQVPQQLNHQQQQQQQQQQQFNFFANNNNNNNQNGIFQQQELQELRQIEALCKQLYQPTSSEEQRKAERTMLEFGTTPDSLTKCRLILESSNSAYAHLLAAQTLEKIVTKHANNFSVDQKLEIRNYSLNFLASKDNLELFVVKALTKLFAKITKLTWFDSKDTQQVLPQINQYFLSVNIDRQITGVLILSQVVAEINQVENDSLGHRSLTRQRRISSTFRDGYLSDLFTLACSILQTSLSAIVTDNRDPQKLRLIEVTLKLAHQCLSFDFIGTVTDESNLDDMPTVQVPTGWRRYFVEPTTTDLFFSLFHALPPNIACHALSSLVQMTSVRRSLFNSAERLHFLNRIVVGLKGILNNPSGLADPDAYHEFCRLLLRFKANFQLTELVRVQNYPELMALIKNFTINSFQSWKCAPNSVHYLLMLWQKLVSSATYCKGLNDHYLDKYAPEVVKAYTTYRLNEVTDVVKNDIEDPLDDHPMLNQQMEQLSYITRQSFLDSGTFLRDAFDSTAKGYQELLATQPSASIELSIHEGRLTWLIYIMSASISGRLFIKSDDDSLEGDLSCRIMQLISLADSQLRQGRRCEKLELAFLNFYDVYRKCYVTDQTQHGNKMHKRLSEVMGLSDESRLLSVFITKIITNLNCWSSSDIIVRNTLAILHELSIGFTSLTKIADLDEVKFMLNHHNPENFPFLGNTTSVEFMRHRTSFYGSLGRLLLENMRNSSEEVFDEFMLPLDKAFDQLRQAIVVNPNPAIAQNQEAKRAFIGLCRDVIGLAKEFVKPPSYVLLFEWIYPNYTQVIKNALELWYNDPNVTTPALKLISELVDNREKRTYEGATPEAIYLFREISSILVTFGTRLLTTEVPTEKIYQYKLKPISISFKILHIALRGKINFAIFQLYGDTVLNDLLQIFIKLFLSIIHCDILIYPKLSAQYFPLLEVLSANHCDFLINLEPQIFGYILESLQAGVTVLNDKTNTSCFIVIHNILSQLFKNLTKVPRKIRTHSMSTQSDESKRKASLNILETHSQIFHSLITIILDLIMSTDSTSHPQLPQPFLCLILLYEDKFNQLRQNVISSYPIEKQATVSSWFDSLMDGISRNLSNSNKDKFIQNVMMFRRQFDPRSLVNP